MKPKKKKDKSPTCMRHITEKHKESIRKWCKENKEKLRGNLGKKRTLESINKMKESWKKSSYRGDKHHLWKGDDASYSACHGWVRNYIQKKYCELCGAIENLDYSNRDHEYRRKLSDWWVLCRKCHKQYDATIKKTKKDKTKK